MIRLHLPSSTLDFTFPAFLYLDYDPDTKLRLGFISGICRSELVGVVTLLGANLVFQAHRCNKTSTRLVDTPQQNGKYSISTRKCDTDVLLQDSSSKAPVKLARVIKVPAPLLKIFSTSDKSVHSV